MDEGEKKEHGEFKQQKLLLCRMLKVLALVGEILKSLEHLLA